MPGIDEALDRVFEAAVLPELWPSALEAMDRAAGTDGGVLFLIHDTNVRWTAAPSMQGLVTDFIDEGWMPRNIRTARGSTTATAGFVTEHDVLTPDEIAHDPMFTEFLRPRGFGWSTGTQIPVVTGDRIVITFERLFDRGPVDRETVQRLDAIRPHLARAGLLAARLGLERLRASVAGLDLIGLPAAAVEKSGRVIVANDRFGALSGAIIPRAYGGFALASPKADALIQSAIRTVDLGRPTVSSVALPGGEAHPPLIFHVIPSRRAAHDLFSRADAFLVVTPVGAPSAPPSSILTTLFDLTPAEARIARLLTEGHDVPEIARTGGVAVDTVRTQIKAILLKTGFHRQAELVGFLSGIGAGAGDRGALA